MPPKGGESNTKIFEKELEEMWVTLWQNIVHLLQANKENNESIMLLRQQIGTIIQILKGILKNIGYIQLEYDSYHHHIKIYNTKTCKLKTN